MPITVECSSCGKKYKVRDDMAGDTIDCKDCGEEIDVPGGRRKSSGSKGRRGKSSGGGGANVGLLIGGIGGGFVLLLIIGFVAFGGRGRPKPLPPDFAPGGTQSTIAVNPNPPPPIPGTTPPQQTKPPGGSRFDQPIVSGPPSGVGGAPKSTSTGPKNPSAGVGLGNVVGVTKHWRRSVPGQRDANVEFKTLQESPDQLPPDFWAVEVDPPTAPVVFEPKKKAFRVKVPIGAGGRRSTTEDIVFPVVPSPFVAVGTNATKKDDREIWNLATGTKAGAISGLTVETFDGALSPDGKYFAARAGRNDKKISVYDIEEKKPACELDVDVIGGFVKVAMPKSNLVVVTTSFGNGKTHVFELSDGTKLHEIENGWGTWNRTAPAYSPGGKYIAMARREHSSEEIWINELETGQNAGKLSLPSYDIGWGLTIDGMAFSHDGKELAATVNGWSCSKILIWNIADGTLVDHMTFPKKLRDTSEGVRDATPLTWFPSGKRLFAFERSIVDRDMGTVIWQIPKGTVDWPGKRWALDDSHVTVLDVSGNSGIVLVYDLPEERIKQSAERLAKTATTRKDSYPNVLVEQPAVVQADYAGITFVAPKEVPWSVKPDPAPTATTSTRPVSLTTGGGGTIREVAVSRGEAPKAVALRSTANDPFGRVANGNIAPTQLKQYRWHSVQNKEDDENSFSSGDSGKKRAWVDIYDLKSGQKSLEIRMKTDGDLMGVSPDGTRFLIWAATKSGRLDLYSTEDGKPVVGWNPYSGEAGEDNQTLVSASLIDAERAVTMNAAGRVVVWKLPEAKALFSIDNASQPAISPNGKYLGYSDGQAYYLVDISSGQVAGSIADIGDVNAVAFHPEGTKMALLSAHKGAYYLFAINLTNGQASPPFPVPVLSGFLHWCGDRYVLLDNQKLVDVEQRVVAWTYELEGDHIPSSPDGRHWFLTEAGGKPQLVAAKLPGSTVEGQLAGVALQPEFVLTPGGKCSLNVQLAALGDGAYAAEIEKAMRDQLARNKITIEAGQPVTLSLTANETTGATVERRYMGFGGGGNENFQLALKTMTCRATFEASGGSGWDHTGSSSNDLHFLRRERNESIQQAIQRSYMDGAKGFFRSFTLPPYVFTPKSANGVGTTKLGAGASGS